MGLQDGKGVEMTLAQDANAPADQSSAPTDQPRSTADEQTENQKPASRANADSDGDIQLDDVKEAGESAPDATATGAAAEAEANETLQTTENKDF